MGVTGADGMGKGVAWATRETRWDSGGRDERIREKARRETEKERVDYPEPVK